MAAEPHLAGANRRESSHRVVCVPPGGTAWRTSSHSGDTGGQCVEVAFRAGEIAVRDSKDLSGPVVRVSPDAFVTFVTFVTAVAEGAVG
ncbi:DUF397 domain-containing protein [Streptomyces sp. NPDC046203]|uniref:DUF397 domain-containing protein n=1 Tax=Streptomyces sp. NPDC046203 TaxID=3154602 RepID=UPI0033CE2AC0